MTTILTTPSQVYGVFGNAISYNQKEKTYRLQRNIELTQDVAIRLGRGQTFDGDNYSVCVKLPALFYLGLFASNATHAEPCTIKHLIVHTDENYPIFKFDIANPLKGGGGIVRPDQRFFTVKHCRNLLDVVGVNHGGICGSNCQRFTIYKCSNGGAVVSGFYDLFFTGGIPCSGVGGLVGTGCSRFLVDKSTNNGPIVGFLAGGITAPNCTDFTLEKSFNYGGIHTDNATYGYTDPSMGGGLVSPICRRFIVKKCENHGDLSDTCGGIIGPVCSDYLVEKSTNFGNMTVNSLGCGGIVGVAQGSILVSSLLPGLPVEPFPQFTLETNYLRIDKCVNFGTINSTMSEYSSGGICGPFFGQVDGTGQAEDIKIRIDDCRNYGQIEEGFGAGLAGSYFGFVSTPTNDVRLDAEIDECYTNYGNLIGHHLLHNQTSYTVQSRLTIKESYTAQNVNLLEGLGDRVWPKGLIYDRGSGSDINLYENPTYIAQKELPPD